MEEPRTNTNSDSTDIWSATWTMALIAEWVQTEVRETLARDVRMERGPEVSEDVAHQCLFECFV